MKSFKQLINELVQTGDKIYRGHSADVIDPHINWFTPDKDLSNEYATGRDKSFTEIQKANFKKPINLGHDRLHMSPADISNHAISQDTKTKYDKSHHEAYDKFAAHFGKKDRPVTDYWSNPENKEHTHGFLTKFGYDAIHMREGRNEKDTVGILSRK